MLIMQIGALEGPYLNSELLMIWRLISGLEGIIKYKAHQTRQSGRNCRPISAEVALPCLQSEIKAVLFWFASRLFLANNLRFLIKLIDKAIVINGKIHKNKRKKFYSSNKECLIGWVKRVTANFYIWNVEIPGEN